MDDVEGRREQREAARVVSSVWRDAAPARAVAEILCLKLDHIGDLLIAAPAMMLLRRSFPHARITLVCAPWNTALAGRLEVADRIVAVTVFDENSVGDLDHDALARRTRTAAARLEALALGAFDIAIDLTLDLRSRELLKLFPASVYAGFGGADAFPFLDVCAPATAPPEPDGPARLRLTAADFAGGGEHPVTQAGLHLSAGRARLAIEMRTDQVWSPAEIGLADARVLGAALLQVEVHERACAEEPPPWPLVFPVVGAGIDGLAFDEGWAGWEPWGRWSRCEVAGVRLEFPVRNPRVRLRCRVQGHTGPQHPKATVWISAAGRQVSRDFGFGDGPEWIEMNLDTQPTAPLARSAPFQLAAGRHAGRLHLTPPPQAGRSAAVALSILGTRPPRTITSVTAQPADAAEAPFSLSFEVRLDDHLEPLVVELRRVGDDADATTPAIRGVDLTRIEPRALKTPAVHMELRLRDLVGMVIARYAVAAPEAEADLARRLARPRAGSSAGHLAAALRHRKASGRRPIGFGVGANKTTKLWPDDYVMALCRRLLSSSDLDLVLFGGAKEVPVAQDLAVLLDGGERVLDLSGETRIEDLGEVLAELDGFIGLDTGPTHFAGRVGVKTVAIFGHAHDPAEWGPVGLRSAWVAVELSCAGCGLSERSQCDFDLRCMTLLKPDDVWAIVEAHLLRPSS